MRFLLKKIYRVFLSMETALKYGTETYSTKEDYANLCNFKKSNFFGCFDIFVRHLRLLLDNIGYISILDNILLNFTFLNRVVQSFDASFQCEN